jgi:GR25 family glycosyltransferase involved in LPS biosynthesis
MGYDDEVAPSLGGYKLPMFVSAMRGRRGIFGLTALVLLGLFWISNSLRFRTLAIKVAASRTPDHLDLIANGTLGFGAIFALGLPERNDKRDALELAAALTGLQITWIDGVPGDKMHPKATPPIHFEPELQAKYVYGMPQDGQIGCWRGHMNIWREMIRTGVSSALILEDDADWDFRIVEQMKKFAVATKELASKPGLQTPKNAATQTMTDSPYGEDWEILHPGHCGGYLHADPKLRNFHTIIRNDSTLPPTFDMHDLSFNLTKAPYNNGTCAAHAGRDPAGRTCDSPRLAPDERIVQLGSPMCTVGYAISQRGARHFLAQSGGVSLLDAVAPVDQLIMELCRGHRDRDGEMTKCMVVSPPYFESHRPRGVKRGESDIIPFGGDIRVTGESHGLVLSTKINLKNLVAGRAPESQYVQESTGKWRIKRIDEYTDQ